MLDEFIADAGNMDESVLMNADINKRAEVDYVTDGTRHNHTGLERIDIKNVIAKDGSVEAVTDVAAGLFKLAYNIVKGRNTDAEHI